MCRALFACTVLRFRIPRKIDRGKGMLHGREDFLKDVLHLYFQRGSVDAGMTAEIGFVQKIPVDQKADRAGGVIHQPENADAAGSNRKSLQHLLRRNLRQKYS